MTTFFSQAPTFTSVDTISLDLNADDFTPASNVLASGATVTLVDSSVGVNNKLDNFSGQLNWSIYADQAGSPGSVVASGNAVSVVETPDGTNIGGRDICTVSFNFGTAVQLNGGTTYWFALREGNQGEGFDGSHIYIFGSAIGNGTQAVKSLNGGTTWSSNVLLNGLAFSLQSTQAPSIVTVTSQTVAENSPFSILVQASDADNDPVGFSITGGADKAFFSMTSTGTLSLLSPADFDVPADANHDNVYEVDVTVRDIYGATDVKTFSLSVTNVDERPIFTSAINATVAEGSSTAYTITAIDPEGQPLTYFVTGGTDASRFSFDSSTGVVTFNTPSDFEAPGDSDGDNVYQFFVVTSDPAHHNTSKTIFLTVTNVNEAPVFTSGAAASVAEGLAGAYIADAVDPENDTIRYSLSGTDGALFDIDIFTGSVSFKGLPDFETPADKDGDNAYEIVVIASDGKFGISNKAVTITVTDQNDDPVFTSAPDASVAENGTAALTVVASDQDPKDTVTYALTGGADRGLFDLDAATGVLVFKAAPDFEAPGDAGGNNVYDVQVTASDGRGGAAVQDIAIKVTNVNELPVFTSVASATVVEGSTAVLTVQASDPDAGDTLHYSIRAKDDGAYFTIDPVTGVLSFFGPPDFETPHDGNTDNVYEVEVTANDGKGQTAVQTVKVTVTDINEAAPDLARVRNFLENFIGKIDEHRTDPDGDTLTYRLAGVDAGAFDIDPTTGIVTFKTAPDFENPADANKDNIYIVKVIATDPSGLASNDNMTIIISDRDEAPVFSSGASETVPEGLAGAYIASATDPDKTAVTYAISGADGALFDIDAKSGAVSFKALPDFEAPADQNGDNVYDIIVIASDATGRTANLAVTITVSDQNDTPVITSAAAVNAAENSSVALHVIASDQDTKDTLIFTISGGADSGLFDIDAATGTLTFKSAPDFEAPGDKGGNNVYDVQVTVSDGNGGTAVQDFAITVTDANDAPAITSAAVAAVAENSTAVLTATASDQDPKDVFTFSISGGPDSAFFDIDGATGVLTFKSAPDFEAPGDKGGDNVYDVRVTVSDGKGGTAVQDIAVTVTDVNDVPVISSAVAVTVAENTSAVLTVTASDQDPKDTLSFTLSGGADAALFSLDAATGALSFVQGPDFEAPGDADGDNVYQAEVTVSDGHGGTDVQTFAITVSNVVGVTVLGTAGGDLINAASAPAGQPFPGAEEDTIIGFGGKDRLVGQMGDDLIRGGYGSDILNGGRGDDTLRGGRGLDFLIGGKGQDHFVYLNVIGSSAAAGIDRIRDFTQGDDVIDLSAIDADGAGGAFHFLGRVRFDGLAGALRSHVVGSDLHLEGDTDGDRHSDFTLILKDAASLHLGGGDLML